MKNSDGKVDFRISTGYFLEALRRIVVGLLAIVGLTATAYGTVELVKFASDFMWRWPKGYLKWDLEFAMVSGIISVLMFAALCFILANALLRLEWSRRIGIWATIMGAGSFIAFVTFISVLSAGMPAID